MWSIKKKRKYKSQSLNGAMVDGIEGQKEELLEYMEFWNEVLGLELEWNLRKR